MALKSTRFVNQESASVLVSFVLLLGDLACSLRRMLSVSRPTWSLGACGVEDFRAEVFGGTFGVT